MSSLFRAAPWLLVVTACFAAACEEPIESPTQAQCDERCNFFFDLNTELACELTFDLSTCDAECMQPDPCLVEQQAFNECRYTVPAEDYTCDQSGTGYPQMTVATCQTQFDAAIDCVSDNF